MVYVALTDEIDFRKHSAVISYFRKEYIKTELFEKKYSDIIGNAFLIRGKSDYDDFFVISKAEVIKQIEDAESFYEAVKMYCEKRTLNM